MRDKEETDRTNTSVLMNNAFETNEILSTPEETLQKYLRHLCTGAVPNEDVRHRAIIQALTINHIQMQRQINKLNGQNTFLTWVVIILMAVTIAAMGYQIYQGQSYQALKKQELSLPTTQNPVPPISSPFQESTTKVAPSKIEPHQTTSQTPRQSTSKDSDTLSKTDHKDQKPSQVPPYEKN